MSRRRRTPARILFHYACFLIVWQALRFTPIGDWWPFELADIFGLALFVPLPLALIQAARWPNRRTVSWAIVPLLLFGWEYGAFFLPQWPPRVLSQEIAASNRPLRVMTANLLVSNGGRAEVGALLMAEQPDVVALQELSPRMAEHLEDEFGAMFPYQLHEPSTSPAGLGILSRHPIRSELPRQPMPRDCYCQRVVVDVGGQAITVVNVHPWPPQIGVLETGRQAIPIGIDFERTARPMRALLRDLEGHPGPLIVLGDFNLGDRQPLYRQIRRDLVDAYVEAGWGFGTTFPAIDIDGLPAVALIRIDYVLHDRSIAARSARTGTLQGSDHRYVVADLALP